MTSDKAPKHHWNYRLIRHVWPTGEVTVGIHEVYYTDGKPTKWSKYPVPVAGEDAEEVLRILNDMRQALASPPMTVEVEDEQEAQ